MTSRLDDPRAPRVRRITALAGRSARQKHGTFLIEGPQSVREALRHTPAVIVEVYLTSGAAERYPEIAAAAPDAHDASERVLRAMSSDAQGVLAVGRQSLPGVDLSNLGDTRLLAYLHQVRDPGNAGTVIRAADAAGADAVILSERSVELYNPKVVRSTAGSLFHLPVGPGAHLAQSAGAARAAGLQVLAADGAGTVTLDELADAAVTGAAVTGTAPADGIDLRRPTMWVFGNEAHGLSDSERDLADAVIRIDIGGRAESLNLAMAATLCLFASARAQRPRR